MDCKTGHDSQYVVAKKSQEDGSLVKMFPFFCKVPYLPIICISI